MMNKKGSSITTWTFAIVLVLVMIILLQSQVLTPMNEIYGKNYETGLNTSAFDSFEELQTSAHSEVEGSEVSQTSDGLTLLSSWAIIKGVYSTLTDFADGTFFRTLFTANLGFPPIIATMFTILMWISLVLIIVYIFMKVVP